MKKIKIILIKYSSYLILDSEGSKKYFSFVVLAFFPVVDVGSLKKTT